jgi:hypothetical protein
VQAKAVTRAFLRMHPSADAAAARAKGGLVEALRDAVTTGGEGVAAALTSLATVALTEPALLGEDADDILDFAVRVGGRPHARRQQGAAAAGTHAHGAGAQKEKAHGGRTKKDKPVRIACLKVRWGRARLARLRMRVPARGALRARVRAPTSAAAAAQLLCNRARGLNALQDPKAKAACVAAAEVLLEVIKVRARPPHLLLLLLLLLTCRVRKRRSASRRTQAWARCCRRPRAARSGWAASARSTR